MEPYPLKINALGRKAQLGDLFNAQENRFYPENIFSKAEKPTSNVFTINVPGVFKIIDSDDKTSIFRALGFKNGEDQFSGVHRAFITKCQPSAETVRMGLYYYFPTREEELDMPVFPKDFCNLKAGDGLPTNYVKSVVYGYEFFTIFSYQLSSENEANTLKASLIVTVNNIVSRFFGTQSTSKCPLLERLLLTEFLSESFKPFKIKISQFENVFQHMKSVMMFQKEQTERPLFYLLERLSHPIKTSPSNYQSIPSDIKEIKCRLKKYFEIRMEVNGLYDLLNGPVGHCITAATTLCVTQFREQFDVSLNGIKRLFRDIEETPSESANQWELKEKFAQIERSEYSVANVRKFLEEQSVVREKLKWFIQMTEKGIKYMKHFDRNTILDFQVCYVFFFRYLMHSTNTEARKELEEQRAFFLSKIDSEPEAQFVFCDHFTSHSDHSDIVVIKKFRYGNELETLQKKKLDLKDLPDTSTETIGGNYADQSTIKGETSAGKLLNYVRPVELPKKNNWEWQPYPTLFIPCPGSNNDKLDGGKKECCSSVPREWTCFQCKETVRCGYDGFFYCKCGTIEPYEGSHLFQCQDGLHTQYTQMVTLNALDSYVEYIKQLFSGEYITINSKLKPGHTENKIHNKTDTSAEIPANLIKATETPETGSWEWHPYRTLFLPCPGSDGQPDRGNKQCCSSVAREWTCFQCKLTVRCGIDGFLYCSCGRTKPSVNPASHVFKCIDRLHGANYIGYITLKHVRSYFESIMPAASKEFINILLLGQTGVGKSTFVNALANYLSFHSFTDAEIREKPLCLIPSKFHIHDENYENKRTILFGDQDQNERLEDGRSQTQHSKSYTFPWGEKMVRVIDTPGIGDTSGKDQDLANMADVVKFISQYSQIHGFCFLLKPNESRLTPIFISCFLELFKQLHKSASKNIFFAFTNSKSTLFRPGDTFKVLEGLLTDVFKEHPEIEIPLTEERYYCMDNEAFRYLVLKSHNTDFQEDERIRFERSWTKSAEESKRMIHYVSGLKPHALKETVVLSTAKKMIVFLNKPLAVTILNLQKEISKLEIKITQEESDFISNTKSWLSFKSKNRDTILVNLEALQQSASALRQEQNDLNRIRAELTMIVTKDSLGEYFDLTREEINLIIEQERHKILYGEEYLRVVKNLQEVEANYSYELKLRIASSENIVPTMDMLETIAEKLYSLTKSGVYLKENTEKLFRSLFKESGVTPDVVLRKEISKSSHQ